MAIVRHLAAPARRHLVPGSTNDPNLLINPERTTIGAVIRSQLGITRSPVLNGRSGALHPEQSYALTLAISSGVDATTAWERFGPNASENDLLQAFEAAVQHDNVGALNALRHLCPTDRLPRQAPLQVFRQSLTAQSSAALRWALPWIVETGNTEPGLGWAAEYGHEEATAYLLDHRISASGLEEALSLAARMGHLQVLAQLLPYVPGNAARIRALKESSININPAATRLLAGAVQPGTRLKPEDCVIGLWRGNPMVASVLFDFFDVERDGVSVLNLAIEYGQADLARRVPCRHAKHAWRNWWNKNKTPTERLSKAQLQVLDELTPHVSQRAIARLLRQRPGLMAGLPQAAAAVSRKHLADSLSASAETNAPSRTRPRF